MEKIELLDLSSLHNDEHYQFMSDFKSLVTAAAPLELGIDDIYPEFVSSFDEEDLATKIERGNARTPVIKKLDSDRGQMWNAIDMRTEAVILGGIETEVGPAEDIMRVIDLYGDKRKAPYNEETASLTNLVADLLSPAHKPNLELLGMLNWVNVLDARNKAFQAEFDARNKELSEKLDGDMREIRGVVDDVLVRIVTRINALIELGQAKPGTDAFTKELNEKIAYFENTLAIRKGRMLAATKARLQPGK